MSDTQASDEGKRSLTEQEKSQLSHLEGMFSAMDKVVRSVRLYQGEGSVVDRQMEDLVIKTDSSLKDGAVTLRLAPFGLMFRGEPVTPDDKRPPYLFQLFCDGVRELTFKQGLDDAELRSLVGVLSTDLHGSDDDLVTLLFKADLKKVAYYAVDALAVSDDGAVADSALSGEDLDSKLQGGTGSAELALSSDDIRNLRTEDLLDWVREAKAPTRPLAHEAALVGPVLSRYESDQDYGRFMDIAVRAGGLRPPEDGTGSPLVVGVFESLIGSGNVDGVCEVLNHLALGGDQPSKAVTALRHELLGPTSMKLLSGLFTSQHEMLIPKLEAVAPYARKGLVALLTELSSGEAEVALQAMLARIGVDLTPFYLKRLVGDDEASVLAAVAALGRIGSEEAVGALTEALNSTLASVRREALQALGGHYHESMRIALGRALRDPDKDNRMLAIGLLAASGDTRVAGALMSYAQKPAFSGVDADEQAAVYQALAAFKDQRLIGHFTKALAERNITRSKTVLQRQMMAVEALRMMGSDEARQALQTYKSKWYLPGPVKQAIASSLSRWSAS